MLDLYNRLSSVTALAPAAKITGATTNGTAVDLLGENIGNNGVMFVIQAGVITDGTFTFKLQDSPYNSTWTDVPAAYVQTASPSWTSATASGTTAKIGYLGNVGGSNRYVRLVVLATGTTTGGFISAQAILGFSMSLPAA